MNVIPSDMFSWTVAQKKANWPEAILILEFAFPPSKKMKREIYWLTPTIVDKAALIRIPVLIPTFNH